jgi:lysozyme
MRKRIIILFLFLLSIFLIFTIGMFAKENTTSIKGRQLIKRFEGLRLTAYRCPAKILTIGWGHTGNVKEGQRITLKVAENLLIADLKRFERHVNDKVILELLYNQFDALVDLSYNCGYVIKGELREAINLRQTKRIEYLIKQYCHVKGSINRGLLRRRNIDWNVYDRAEYPE